MNSAEITRAKSPLADHIELDDINDEPAVGATGEVKASTAELSNETEAGILRFARFLKQSAKHKNNKRDDTFRRTKAIQVYESIMNYSKRERPGQMLDVTL